MSDTNNEPDVEPVQAEAGVFEKPKFTGSLRDLIRQRTEMKARRTHKQWYCFDPAVVTARREAEAEFVAVFASEFANAPASQQQRTRKNGWTPQSQQLSERVDELKAREREIGANAVFHNLTSEELDGTVDVARKAGGTEFALGKAILLAAFMYWETADGQPIDLLDLGKDDLDAYLDPEITDEGDWKPLADAIIQDSKNPIDLPTSLSS